MDKFFPALFVLLLLSFAALAAIDACAKAEVWPESQQDAAVERGEGEYYIDPQGVKRFRWR